LKKLPFFQSGGKDKASIHITKYFLKKILHMRCNAGRTRLSAKSFFSCNGSLIKMHVYEEQKLKQKRTKKRCKCQLYATSTDHAAHHRKHQNTNV
jgi:hypothetical protein